MKNLVVSVTNPDGSAAERLFARHGDEIVCYNAVFKVAKGAQRAGAGTARFAAQVAALKKHGAARIETSASGRKGDPEYNGYYTWPRLGYGGKVRDDDFRRLPRAIRSKMGASREIRDLFDLPGGKEAWQDYGATFDAEFDLRDGSRNLKALQNYLAEKQASRGG